MKYDRDIRWIRRLVLLLIAVNLGFAIHRFLHRDWINGLAAIVWTVNCAMTFGAVTAHQKTRDLTREASAAILRVLVGDDWPRG